MPKITIVAVTRNNKNDALNFIKSIKKLDFPKNQLEVIIIDNGSIDNTPQSIKKIHPHLKLIKLNTNTGAPHALNIGFKKANGKYIFKCDSDIILEKNSLETLISYIENIEDNCIVGPKIYFKDKPRKITPSAAKFNPWLGTISTYPNLEKTQKVDYLQGCAFVFPKIMLKTIGYLDEGYGLWLFDDQDFCFRAKKHNIKIVYYPKAEIWHSITSIAMARPKAKLEQWYKNKIRFIIKNANPPQIISSLALQALSIPYHFIFSKDYTAQAIINGFVINIKNLNSTLSARKQAEYGITKS